MRTRHGFTLIELLIVIAIIAILAAIFFPVFATAREKARQAACTSNLKQLGLGITQYTQDYDEHWPAGIANCSGPLSNGWANLVYPYVKSSMAYNCPDDNNGVFVSYAANSNLSDWTGKKICQVSQFVNPSVSIGLFEVFGQIGKDPSTSLTYGSYGGDGIDSVGPYDLGALEDATAVNNGLRYATGVFGNILSNTPVSPTAPFSGMGRHNGGANYLMLDCHVKWLNASKVSAGMSNNVGGADPGNYLTGGSSKTQYGSLTAATTAYCGAGSIAVTFSLM